jgi:hypothetical protein
MGTQTCVLPRFLRNISALKSEIVMLIKWLVLLSINSGVSTHFSAEIHIKNGRVRCGNSFKDYEYVRMGHN